MVISYAWPKRNAVVANQRYENGPEWLYCIYLKETGSVVLWNTKPKTTYQETVSQFYHPLIWRVN